MKFQVSNTTAPLVQSFDPIIVLNDNLKGPDWEITSINGVNTERPGVSKWILLGLLGGNEEFKTQLNAYIENNNKWPSKVSDLNIGSISGGEEEPNVKVTFMKKPQQKYTHLFSSLLTKSQVEEEIKQILINIQSTWDWENTTSADNDNEEYISWITGRDQRLTMLNTMLAPAAAPAPGVSASSAPSDPTVAFPAAAPTVGMVDAGDPVAVPLLQDALPQSTIASGFTTNPTRSFTNPAYLASGI